MQGKIRIAGTIKESIVNGPGIRFVVFAQGCKHKCTGCHNPHTHSFSGGTIEEVDEIVCEMRKNPLLDGITLSGGEPFEQAEGFSELAKKVKKLGYTVMTYTGYTYEYIQNNKEQRSGWAQLLKWTDILVDGRFEITKKSMMLKFRGSHNQRVIDVKQSLELRDLVLI